MHDAIHAGSLLPLPLHGLSLAQISLLPELSAEGQTFSYLEVLTDLIPLMHYLTLQMLQVADFEKSDPCLVVDPPRWTEESFAVPA